MQIITERAKYLQLLEQVASLAKVAQSDAMSTRISALTESVRKGELLIPIVGGFSAGKSTLLNTLMGRSLLPTAIRPETALATELHYGDVEYIDAFDSQNQAHRYEISQFAEINNNAANYTHLKIYLNCSLLRDIEPAVLVDMPGFESPLDLHNKAIDYYLDKGCLYVGLISCQDGTLTESMLLQLEKIDSYGCPFHIFVSKTDLRTQSEVDEVVETIQGQLSIAFLGSDMKVGTVNNKSAQQVEALLTSIDCNALFRNKYLPSIKQVCEALSSDLKMQVDVMEQGEHETIEQAVRSMNNAINELKQKQHNLSLNLESQFNLNQLQNEVIVRVESDLKCHSDQIVTQVMAGHLDQAQASFTDVVHTAVVNALNGKLQEIDQKIFKQYQEVIGAVDLELKQNCMSSIDLSSQVAQLVKTDFDLSRILVNDLNSDSNDSDDLSTMVLKGLRFLSKALPLKNIVTGVVILLNDLLPGLISKLFNKINKDAVREKAKELLENLFVNQVLADLKPKVLTLLTQEVRNKINAVSASFAKIVEEKSASMQQIIEQRKTEPSAQQTKISELKQASAKIDSLVQNLA